jgi:hypothetical protein
MSEVWYYVDSGGSVGPLTTLELRKTLRTLPNSNDILVWCDDFPSWKKAGDVSELGTRLSAPARANLAQYCADAHLAGEVVVGPRRVIVFWLDWKPGWTKSYGLGILRTH